MTPTAAKRPKPAARPRKPVYLTVRKLVDPATGEIVGALVPRTTWDQRALRDRGYKSGTELRAELKRPRNPKFHAMAHALGALIVEHCEGFEEMETHAALKKAQREAGVCCEEMELDLGPLGMVKVKQARSMAFDEMDGEEFDGLVHGVCAWLREKFHGIPPSELDEIITAIETGHA